MTLAGARDAGPSLAGPIAEEPGIADGCQDAFARAQATRYRDRRHRRQTLKP